MNYPNMDYKKLEEVLYAAELLAGGVIVCIPCKECEENATKLLDLLRELRDARTV